MGRCLSTSESGVVVVGLTRGVNELMLASLSTKVVDPLEEKVRELPRRRATDKG